MKRFVAWVTSADRVALNAQTAPELFDGCTVFCRGYIANVSALIEEAKNRGEALTEVSDGRLFAKSYRWWGDGLQSRVLGEYAVAVFDWRTSSLLLTHDALGLVPCFYAQQADRFLFASPLEPLLLLTKSATLDEEYIADYLATGMVISARTPFANIRRLLPGESLHWAKGTISVRKTWDITRIRPVTLASDEEYEESFRTLLREGVAAALRTDGTVWSELSGGLDSSSLVSVAAHSGAKRLGALSVIYTSSKSADESEWMKLVIRRYNLPWHTIDADQSKPFSELPGSFCPEPIDVLPAAGLFRRYKALAESHGVQVILSGYGGDQILCGDSPKPFYLADFLPFHPANLLTELRDWQASDRAKRSLAYHFITSALRPSLQYWTRHNLNGYETSVTPHWIHPEYLRVMRLSQRSCRRIVPACRSVGQQYLAERIWRSGFAIGNEHSQPFDFRYPLLYRRLVEFMLAIPWKQRLLPGQDRYLQRRALKGILPEQIRLRKDKAGPAEAESEGLRNRSPWTALFLTRPRIVEREYVDAPLWCEAVHQARFGRIVSMRHFVAAATLEVWLRQLEERQRASVTSTSDPYREKDLFLFEASGVSL